MNEVEIKMECLRLASASERDPSIALKAAAEFYDFVFKRPTPALDKEQMPKS